MKKTVILLAAMLLIIASLTGCVPVRNFVAKNIGAFFTDGKSGDKGNREETAMEYISSTSDSLTVKIVNNTDSTWQSGNMRDYRLEIEKNGEWYEVTQIGELANTMELMLFAPGEEMTHTFYFAGRYGKLIPGKYRVVKSWWANATETTPAGEFYLTCEFTVE